MTEEKKTEEITGWVAWHPHGIDFSTFRGDEQECWSAVVNEGKYGENYESLSDYEFAIIDAQKAGWRIRPVKVVFTDDGAEK
ncbi:MAG: hypothetical protein E6Q97_00940 [Desulfurellales bacterium]|nr:MAG: hypothetical protein E6Q97_00940 [Desulfurellales bacterium]